MAAIARDTGNIRPRPRLPGPKRTRHVNVIEPPTSDSDGCFAVRLSVGDDNTDYLICPFVADWGEGYSVEKLGPDLETVEQYDVNLCGPHSTCTCAGFSYHAHCKHLESLLALDARGRLPRRKQKHSACPRCFEPCDGGQLCERCAAEEEEYAAYHQRCEMEAGQQEPGIMEPFADEPPELPESAYFDPEDL
jgi:hypothetical protein